MLNKQNGITLIALIITIIVMLILVGVTINVALNGGLFEKAETATTETKKALEKEELMQIVLAEYDVKSDVVNADNVKTKAGTNYTEDTSKSKAGKTLVLKGKSGIFWEINLETAQVKEYEEVTVTSTIWEQRGVTSPNVKFDVLYYNAEIIPGIDANGGMTFGLYSNGDICLNDGDELISNTNTTENNLGNCGIKTSDADTYISQNLAKCFENGVTFPWGTDGNYWTTVRYTSDDTIKVYHGQTSDLDSNGNIPEEDTYYQGSLQRQQ